MDMRSAHSPTEGWVCRFGHDGSLSLLYSLCGPLAGNKPGSLAIIKAEFKDKENGHTWHIISSSL